MFLCYCCCWYWLGWDHGFVLSVWDEVDEVVLLYLVIDYGVDYDHRQVFLVVVYGQGSV